MSPDDARRRGTMSLWNQVKEVLTDIAHSADLCTNSTKKKPMTKLKERLMNLGMEEARAERVSTAFHAHTVVCGLRSDEALNSELTFAQCYAAGTLGGDELRSIVENVPTLMKPLRREMKTQYGMPGCTIREMAGRRTSLLIDALDSEGRG